MNKRNIIYVKYLLTTINDFVHNNGLVQQVTFGKSIARRRDGCSMRLWSENPSLRRVYSGERVKDVAALPGETVICQKLYKVENTVLNDIVLKYFLQIYLVSFSRHIKVSIKHYEISFGFKYSVHGLIYDVISIHEPQ